MQDVTLGGFTLRYSVDRGRLPASVADRLVALEHDAPARAFVEASLATPHGRLVTVAYDFLRKALSDYDAYGLLGMYPMHLCSREQLARLLGALPPQGKLLDVGAGDGGITELARGLFGEVLVTETSRVLRARLRRRGFRVLEHDFEHAALPSSERFAAIFCLNVLDRCARPRTLLAHLTPALAPDGRLLVSVPLTLRPHVHVGRHTVDPDEPLPSAGPDWEAGATALIEGLFAPAGLRLQALARVPYLCRGDARTALHVLDAALFVLER